MNQQQTNVMFNYDPNSAAKGGASGFIDATGAYTGKITIAKWVQTQNGAKALELSFTDDQGAKADYLSMYYSSRSGEPIAMGQNLIQAVMGCAGVKQLTATAYNGNLIAPELTNKRIGLFLQKVLRLKQNGSETHSFSIITPFDATTGKTVIEQLNNRPAERISQLVATMKDKDERAKQQQPAFTQQPPVGFLEPPAYSEPPVGYELNEDMPF